MYRDSMPATAVVTAPVIADAAGRSLHLYPNGTNFRAMVKERGGRDHACKKAELAGIPELCRPEVESLRPWMGYGCRAADRRPECSDAMTAVDQRVYL
ncbi:hypothetical protein GSbR_29810 [Geobacter sp. SVR]|nr:hypothetical protein GSVR_31190 [Geobacter sp. SVR]GCF86381.1 hypothetical protein GSbR_29810 [Geobacter sp. SVR]